ncbi:histidyl-tRNA synthetase, mitochondrial precursor [Purpureocillium lilacinum]|uniref:histidine--tRNA ligase n=1 Tax=Purpureocillium lilacinum TaxID=33203 RepID=A0A179HU62_PURLI|nr:histidyl-tRNA synthetase, mitochondrial precursor [Purpureocillium lilacinum]OAQ93917.1 histidyl-tRNA synthetase, mitochondrial precursor [Purpureocillium lilacinum]
MDTRSVSASRSPTVTLKTPKGTRDWSGRDILIRDEVFKRVIDVFRKHGGTPLDTPVFELKGILSEKYGEDSKLIYDLQDQGGEICSLRYDLTVPFARWLAMNNIESVKRYHIAKVYRRDQPAVSRGRFREFHQCDFDIAGVHDPMVADAEVLRIIVEVFDALKLDVTIKLNHRQVLDGIFAVAGVTEGKIRTISSAIDKLDKSSWQGVKGEMIEKGLAADVADRIGEYVRHAGTIPDTLTLLNSKPELLANKQVEQGIYDMKLLASYVDAFGISDKVSFDLSLARGLDYYTGLIYEVVSLPPKPKESAASGKKPEAEAPITQVGSLAAGGRYDDLVGMYGKKQIPCVGISFGVDRILTILEARQWSETLTPDRGIQVYIIALGDKDCTGLLIERMSIAQRLWSAGIRAEFFPKVKPKMTQQFKAAEGVPLGLILGREEAAAGQVRVKRLGQSEHKVRGAEPVKGNGGELVLLDDMVEEVRKLLGTRSDLHILDTVIDY